MLQRIDWDANQITGQSDENQNCILFMSIPYSSGWSCFIDGNRTKVYRADYGFSAALVPAGMHSISWVYRTPWLRMGLLLTIIGMAILIVLFARCWSERRSGKTKSGEANICICDYLLHIYSLANHEGDDRTAPK